MSHLKTFTKGILLGGLVGIIYGFFNAPKKGKELQKEARRTVEELVRKGKKIQRKATPKVKSVLKKIEKSARGARLLSVGQGSVLGRKALKKGKRMVKKVKTTAKKYKKGKKK